MVGAASQGGDANSSRAPGSGGFRGGAQGARAPPFLTQVYNVYHFEGQRINNVT